MRVVCSATYTAHTEPLLKACNVIKVNHIYETKMLMFYHKLLHNTLPSYFYDFMPSYSTGNTRYPFREPRFQLPIHSHEHVKHTCRYQLPTLINTHMQSDNSQTNIEEIINFSDMLRNAKITPVSTFKKFVKAHYLSWYSYD